MTPRIEPFAVDFDESMIADLRVRLTNARFVEASDDPWRAGTDPTYLRALLDHWRTDFDWSGQQDELNAHPQFTADVAGTRLHFAHLRANGEHAGRATPIVLTHGWPSSFVEMLPLARRLADPARFGADPADAFDVVVPSLPGIAYSAVPQGPVTPFHVAGVWTELMTEVLGYDRFGAYGGDVGSHATNHLGAAYPRHTIGIYTHHPYCTPPSMTRHRSPRRSRTTSRSARTITTTGTTATRSCRARVRTPWRPA